MEKGPSALFRDHLGGGRLHLCSLLWFESGRYRIGPGELSNKSMEHRVRSIVEEVAFAMLK